ncbi:MAG TPA: 4-hydroxy-3-methylbut-2-enyl diphosphate reductase [Nitrospirae bacterium]|nr:4-hydroxy-3-methylbut-2-enyl diphosphate reductase [Nitrospirota bacterium]HDN94704.1 4-hydroxy-3-methylbut-2-enyl diphosphate reductase [Nitrospirota bacterium]
MKVKLAKTAGFCMGVRRAMNIALDAVNKKEGKLYTYGPLVHNPQAIEMLRQKGVEIIDNKMVSNATVIIRAHGVAPDERKRIKETGNVICDATCPHVAKAHSIIKKGINKGYNAIIIGDKDHAEVNGLLGFAGDRGYVVENTDDVDKLSNLDNAYVVAQTTQNRKTYEEIIAKIKEKIPDTEIFDTICDSTNMRQKEALELAKEVDAMVIIGGKNSANTKRLYELSLSTGTPSFHIEAEDKLDNIGLELYENIGVMAGASTPNWVIKKAIDRIKYLQKKSRSSFYMFLESISSFIVDSSLYLGLGAVSMCYASLVFQDIMPSAMILLVAFLYVFTVHVFNRYTERLNDELFDPSRTRFFKVFGKPLIITATIASFISMFLSYKLGVIPFALLLFSYMMGILYSIRIVPEKLLPLIKYKKLRDVPGSKDIFIAIAWAWVIVLIPALKEEIHFTYQSMVILSFVSLTVFIRSVIFDIISIEDDRIVGRETIPTIIGLQKTEAMLMIISIIIGVFLFSSAATGLVPTLGYFLIIPPVLMVICLYIFQKQRLQTSSLFEAIVDSNFILAGVITYLWQMV